MIVAALAGAAFLLVVFYPGAMSIDSYYQLGQARSGRLGNWHPPFMAWLWGGMDFVLRGPILMLVAQIGLVVLGLTAIAGPLLGRQRALAPVLVVLSILITPVSGIVGVIWKDVWSSGLLLLGAAVCLRLDPSRKAGERWRLFACAALFFLAALLFRPNVLFAAVPLLAYGAWLGRGMVGSWRSVVDAVVLGAACTLVLALGSAGANRVLTSDRQYPVQSILTFDIVGVSVRSDRADFLDDASERIPDVLRGRHSVDMAVLRPAYYASTWNPLVFRDDSPLALTRSGTQVGSLARLWRRCVREESRAYLSHRAAVFREVIGAHERPLFAPVYFGIPVESPDYATVAKRFPLGVEEVSPMQRVLRAAFSRSAELTFYRPWFWLVLNVLLTVVALLPRVRRHGLVALGLSGLLCELALFFIAPGADYRYSHWLVLSTWLLAAGFGADFLCKVWAWSGSAADAEPPTTSDR